ncbi:MAG: hypothetical protein H6974_02690 [Gammaproteobacteria bacterium]|nr:hypothetical protein [Gammaproteobacteria bacterium]MCP5195689.1 hypothetical protein [Gammaproteobacteria bacterium]
MLRAESHRLRAGDSDSLRNPFFDRRGRSSSLTHFDERERALEGDFYAPTSTFNLNWEVRAELCVANVNKLALCTLDAFDKPNAQRTTQPMRSRFEKPSLGGVQNGLHEV